jgi:[protein-PII] uridylyltransferase
LLALIAGVLALNRLPVRSATAMNIEDMALDTFDVDLTGREPPDVNALHADLTKYLADPESLQRRLLQRATSNRLPRRPGAAHIAEPYVLIINDATPKATIVEVRAPDGFGVLSRIGHAIADCGCDIDFARALTLGHEVVDTFYVIDGESGAKITGLERLGTLEDAILESL